MLEAVTRLSLQATGVDTTRGHYDDLHPRLTCTEAPGEPAALYLFVSILDRVVTDTYQDVSMMTTQHTNHHYIQHTEYIAPVKYGESSVPIY